MLLLAILGITIAKILPITSTGNGIYALSLNTGVTTDYYFSIITQTSVSAGDYLKIQFPPEYSSLTLPSSACLVGTVTATCVLEGSSTVKLTLPSVISSNTRYTIKVPSITNPAATTTSYFKLLFQYSVSSQIIDFNDAFATLQIFKAPQTATGALLPATSTAGAVVTYTLSFTLASSLPATSVFQVILPTGYLLKGTCAAAAYSASVAAVGGKFACQMQFGALIISGLTESLAAGRGVAFTIGLMNPNNTLTAGEVSFEVRTLTAGSSFIIDKALVLNTPVTEGAVTAITHGLYSSYTKWVTGNLVYTSLSFKLTNQVAEGGTIVVDYTVAATAGLCVLAAGFFNTAAGANPVCTVSGNTATISNFGSIAAGTTLQVINQLTSATLTAMTITSKTSTSKNIDRSTTGGAIASDATFSTSTSATFSCTPSSTRLGTFTIVLTTAGAGTITAVKIMLPSSITAQTSAVCTVGGVGSTCSLSNSVITITANAGLTCNAGCTLVLDTSTAGQWKFPNLGSSLLNFYEVSTQVEFASSKEYFTLSASISNSQFSAASVSAMTGQSIWSYYSFSLTLLNALPSTTTAYIKLSFTGFTGSSLGTGLANGAIGCLVTGLTAFSATLPVTCTLTTDPTTPYIKISSFAAVSASTAITAKFIFSNPASTPVSITIAAEYVLYNSITVTTDVKSLSITLLNTYTAWPTLTSSDVVTKSVNSVTSLTIALKSTAVSAANDNLFVAFPAGWNVTSATATIETTVLTTTAFTNSYAPCLLVSLGTYIIQSSGNQNLIIQLKTGAFQFSGAGKVYVSLVKAADWSVTHSNAIQSSGTDLSLAGASKSAFVNATFEISSNFSSAGDVLYKFNLTINNTIPSTGKILISLSDAQISTSYCTFSSSFGSTVTCSVGGNGISVTGFSALRNGTVGYVKVFNVINSQTSSTGAVTVTSYYSSSDFASIIDSSSITGLGLRTAGYIANTTISTFKFYPTSSTATGQLLLQFYMDTSVPKTGQLTVTFASEFSLPTITDANCYFSLKFASCASSGNALTITPVTAFSAGVLMTLIIPAVTVPANSTVPLSITSKYSGLTLSQTSPTAPAAAFFYASKAVTNTTSVTVAISPTNLAEPAMYTFIISGAIRATDVLVIWLPSTYPANLGNIYCKSTASSKADKLANCTSGYMKGIVVNGLVAATGFTLAVYNLNNPGVVGATGNIVLQVIDSNSAVVYSASVSGVITQAPSGIQIMAMNLSDYNINAITNYTIIHEATALPSQIWIDFPSEFNNQLIGFGENFTCFSYLTDAKYVSEENWVSGSATCQNTNFNRIVMNVAGSGSVSGKYMKTVLVGIKSPSSVGLSGYFRISLIGTQNMIVSRSYDFSTTSQVTFAVNKQVLVIGNFDSSFTMNSGVSQTYYIYTASSKVVAKEDIQITYAISSLNSTTGITVSPGALTLKKGSSSLAFSLNCDSSLLEGTYIIKWSASSSKYLQPQFSRLTINYAIRYTITISNVPKLTVGTTCFPIIVSAAVSPLLQLTIIPTIPAEFTFSPITFASGSSKTTYTISLTANATAGTYSVPLRLSGDIASIFSLDASSLNLIVNTFDQVIPSIISFVIDSPRYKTSISMTMQASEPAIFYYTFGERGLAIPSNASLVTNSTNGSPGFYYGYIDASLLYKFSFSGLVAEYDYVLYGIMGDAAGNMMTKVFAIDLFTAEIDNSVTFTLGFDTPYPTSGQISGDVINALAYQFVVPSSRLSLVSSTSSTATYQLTGSSTTDDPSPINIIRFTAIPSEINALLTGFNLSLTYDIDSTIVELQNPRPVWYIYPSTVNTTKSSIFVTFALLNAGTVHAEIIGDSESQPSSRQIVLGANAFGSPANLTYSQAVKAKSVLIVEFGGLVPTNSYTLLITAENNNSRNRIMKDELMAQIDFITQAGVLDTNSTNQTDSYGCVLALVGVWIAIEAF